MVRGRGGYGFPGVGVVETEEASVDGTSEA